MSIAFVVAAVVVLGLDLLGLGRGSAGVVVGFSVDVLVVVVCGFCGCIRGCFRGSCCRFPGLLCLLGGELSSRLGCLFLVGDLLVGESIERRVVGYERE